VGTLALRVAGARKTYHRGHTEAVVFHAVDPAVETGEICEHKWGRSRFSRRVKYPEPWGRGGRAARLTRAAPNPYEVPGCQEAKYSHERNLCRFFMLAKSVSGGAG